MCNKSTFVTESVFRKYKKILDSLCKRNSVWTEAGGKKEEEQAFNLLVLVDYRLLPDCEMIAGVVERLFESDK